MGFLSLLFYILASFSVGGVLILISLSSSRLNYLDYLKALLDMAYNIEFSQRVIMGISGLLIILICIRYLQNSASKARQEKTIAFKTSTGDVIIALSAVEEMIKKILADFKEIKEMKPNVIALKKKGLKVTLKIILSSEVEIPEFTSRIQNLIRDKLQEVLGIEENINVNVEIKRFSYPESKKMKWGKEEEKEVAVPFRKY